MWCDVDDTSVYYETVGDGRPIVFLHGWSMDHRVEISDYEPIFDRHPEWRRIYLDLPGMGRTTAGPSITSQDRILAVVLKFIDQVLPRQRFALSGTSAGAYLARGVVRDRAGAIDGLLLRVPCIIADDARRTVPSFHPLIEDRQLLASLDSADRGDLGDILVHRPSTSTRNATSCGPVFGRPSWQPAASAMTSGPIRHATDSRSMSMRWRRRSRRRR